MSKSSESLDTIEAQKSENLKEESKVLNLVIGFSLAILSGVIYTGTNYIFKHFSLSLTDAVAARSVLQVSKNFVFKWYFCLLKC